METEIIFYTLLLLVAFLYAAVGHGGASGYLALMAIFNVAPPVMKPTALLLNVFVSLIAFIQFYKGRHFNIKIFFPFAIASVPMAFVGGLITIDTFVYKKILAILLFFAVGRMLFMTNNIGQTLKPVNIYLSLAIGAVIGLLSGITGIGGGIVLAPVLLLLKWTNIKQAAAISALFIFVNSIAGLAGQFTKGIHFGANIYIYAAIAFVGGLLGAYFGATRFKQPLLRYILVLVLLIAACKLLFTTG